MTRGVHRVLGRVLPPDSTCQAVEIAGAIEDAFRLTGFFFSRHVYEPRGFGEPEARAAFIGALRRRHAGPSVGSGESAA